MQRRLVANVTYARAKAASLFSALLFWAGATFPAGMALDWRQLPPLPDPLGFGGPFAGIAANVLVVAGGANFPGKMPWEGGRKIWHDTGFVLDRTNGTWRTAFKLPRSLGYGVSISTAEGIVCIGGCDANEHVRDVFRITSTVKGWECQPLAPLPQPLAYSCGALVGDAIYVAGGTSTTNATQAMSIFWSLDLGKPGASWRELQPCPGPARMLAVSASVGGSFYLAGGASLAPDASGKPVRTYLKDTHRFTPGSGWKRVTDMPNPVVASPTPAPVAGDSSFLVVSGDDGSLADFEPISKHPGFPNRVLSYDTLRDEWSRLGETPAPRATLPAVVWDGLIVLPSGEVKPGIRSPQVWGAAVKRTH
jgi:N-acetylneuraminate epimerase